MEKVDEDKAISIVNPTFGSDPEMFVYSLEKKRIQPVTNLLGGTKQDPRPLPKEGFFVQEDNVLAEFNIPPTKNRAGFISAISTGQQLVVSELKQKGFVPVLATSHRFLPEDLSDPREMIFGCTPDCNAWLGLEVENPTPFPENDPFLRSAGGHVIVGYDNPTRETNVALIKLCDALVGLPSVLLDTDTERRKLYGKAGSFRHKPYGVEYRTLSSFWLGSEKLTGWVWDRVSQAIDMVNAGNFYLTEYEPFIVDTINTANVANAKQFVNQFEIVMPD